MKCKFIFVTGGVISSVGKGLTAASIASLLQSTGLKVAVRKLDPYLNVDPGTMSPVQHGEVFVTEDGAETDLDLGYYERFTGNRALACDSITAGRIYSDLLSKERRGDYLGQTVQVIPHVTDLIKNFIYNKNQDLDVIICEIGGTVGDIEGQPFFESIRQIAYQIGKQNVCYVHVTLVPYVSASGEIKTKPTQHSVKSLNAVGIQADIIICRAQKVLSLEEKKKIALFCNIKQGNVIEVTDVENIYHLPFLYQKQDLDQKILGALGIDRKRADTTKWQKIVEDTANIKESSDSKIKIALVGKYCGSRDIYKSVIEAINHACLANRADPQINMIDAKDFKVQDIKNSDCVVIPGGFGSSGIESKISAIKYARENSIPLLGICLGFQLITIEFARNVLGLEDANSTEFKKDCKNKVIALLEEWHSQHSATIRKGSQQNLGGTMRLGAHECILKEGSRAHNAYKKLKISERHRHRYEANNFYQKEFESAGLEFSGYCALNTQLPEIAELKNHPWFVGVQFHPEFRSRIFDPHPLFVSLVEAAKKRSNQKSSIN